MSDQLIALILAHKWLALVAVLDGALVRLLKDDTRLPTLDKRWRFLFALVFGIAAGVFDKVLAGGPWGDALVIGIITGLAPAVGHLTIVKGLLNGKDIPIPNFLKAKPGDDDSGDPPAPPATPTGSPSAPIAASPSSLSSPRVGLLGLAFALFVAVAGCGWLQSHPDVPGAETAKTLSCVAHAEDIGLSPRATMVECGVELLEDVIHMLAAKHAIEQHFAAVQAETAAHPSPASSASSCPGPVKP